MIVSFALFGSVSAQNWHKGNFLFYDAFNAYVQIDGNFIDVDDNYADLEIAAFADGQCRTEGARIEDYTDEGDLYPMIDLMIWHDYIQGTNTVSENGKTVTFMMYDHANGILYENCTPSIEIVLGQEHPEILAGDNDNAVILNFTSSGYTLDITPYEDPEGRDHYYLIASPVGAKAASAVTNLTSNSYDLYSFNPGAELEWINHRDEEGFELQPGVGYLYANSGTGAANETITLTFNGTPLEGETFELGLTTADEGDGLDFPEWNLVGNPFEVTAYPNAPFYTMNPENGAYIPNDANAELPAMNGAFVYNGETAVSFNKTPGSKAPMLALNLSSNGKVLDRAIVSFGQGQQLPKLQFRDNSTKVYIPMDGNDYALVRSEGMGEMPVSFKAETNGTYSLSLSSENADFAYLHLIDNLTGADQDLLANPSYSFSANTTDYASRFRLVFATGSDEENFAFFSNGSLFVNNEGNATLQIVDVTGRIIKCESINGCANVNINAASGVYMVRLVNGDNVKLQKVVK